MIRRSSAARIGAMLLVTSALGASLAAAAGELPYRVLHRIPLSGAAPVQALAYGPGGKHLYAAAGAEVLSFQAATGASEAVVKVPGQVAGLAASPDGGGTLYVAVRAPARLFFLGLNPLRVRSSVPIRGGAPSALLYEPAEHALYVESRSGRTVARLDSADGKTVAVTRLQGDLEQMTGDGRGTVYVANAASDAIDVLASGNMKSLGAIPTPDCRAPTGLDLDPVGRRLFVACSNGTALIIDTDMGFAFEQLAVQKATGLRTLFAFHPNGPAGWKGGAFIAGAGPALDAIRMNAFISYTAAGSMPLPGRATALAASPAAGQLSIALAPRDGAAAHAASAADEPRQQAGMQILVLGSSGGAQ
ncbi:MAG: hypothetical protein KGL45_12460 [Gammaproteobacteria bacterium]|nr:hypothetical protein [Gammaproteobacteria bacterium]